MATYDDYDGVYFTVQALRLYHPEVLDDTNFVVIDYLRRPLRRAAKQQVDTLIANYRYVPARFPIRHGGARRGVRGGRQRIRAVLTLHVSASPRDQAATRLLPSKPGYAKLLQGPLHYDDLTKTGSHFHPDWRAGMYGYWEGDPRADDPDGAPFDIPVHGLGLFACRRAAWPGFNPQFRGFGGEEGYIHEKFRRRRAIPVPAVPAMESIASIGRSARLPHMGRPDAELSDRLSRGRLAHRTDRRALPRAVGTRTSRSDFRAAIDDEFADG